MESVDKDLHHSLCKLELCCNQHLGMDTTQPAVGMCALLGSLGCEQFKLPEHELLLSFSAYGHS